MLCSVQTQWGVLQPETPETLLFHSVAAAAETFQFCATTIQPNIIQPCPQWFNILSVWERPGPTGQSQGTRCYLERPGSRRVSDHRWLLNCFCPNRPTIQLSWLQGADQALWAVQWQFTLWAEDLGKGHRVYRDTPEGLWHHLACKRLRISGGCSNTALVRWRPVTG